MADPKGVTPGPASTTDLSRSFVSPNTFDSLEKRATVEWVDVTDSAVELYRLLVKTTRPLTFEEARDKLGLSRDDMRLVVDLLNDALESDSRDEITV